MFLNELILSNLIRSLNFKRALNLIKTGSSFLLSALLKRNILWGRPAVLTIEPTNICNLRCPLCTTGAGEMKRASGKMSLDTFKAIIDKMGDDIFFLLLYHQGEPYLNKHFLDFVKLAKSKKIYCTTSTNGHYFSDQNINDTIDSELDSMIISLDGATQKTFEKYRIKGEIEKVIDGTRRFMAIKKERKSKTPLIAAQFLVMKHNEHELPAVKKLSKEMGIDRLLIKNIEVRSIEEAKLWLPVNDKYRRYNFDGKTLEVKNSDKKSCPRPWLSTLVNWDGSVVPCCFDKNGKYSFGKITKTTTIKQIWKSNEYRKFRSKILQQRQSVEICRNCTQNQKIYL